LKDEDKELIKKLIKENPRGGGGAGTSKNTKAERKSPAKKAANGSPQKAATNFFESPKKGAKKTVEEKNGNAEENGETSTILEEKRPKQGIEGHKDNSFRQFRQLCALVAEEPSYNAKTEIIQKFFTKGTNGKSFMGDLYVWIRLLLPGVVKRIYNMQSKQLIKIFSRMFSSSEEEMLEDLESGDVAETVAKFFEESINVKPATKSKLSIHDVDDFLSTLTKLTKEEVQLNELKKITKCCTANDLKMVIRLIKHDLRIQAGAKHVLDALHKDAYEAFNSSRNIIAVIDKVLELREKGTPNASLDVGISLMHPVQPMLAMPCKSVDEAFKRCPNGKKAFCSS